MLEEEGEKTSYAMNFDALSPITTRPESELTISCSRLRSLSFSTVSSTRSSSAMASE